MKKSLCFAALVAVAVSTPALADNNVVITSLVVPPVPTTNQWGALPGEQSAGAVTELVAGPSLDGDGSLHIAGDRTRVQTGIQYSAGPGTPTNTGILANDLVSLTGDYIVNALGTNTNESAAFRVLIQDGSTRSELIWEAANQVGYTGITTGVWASAGPNDLFWQYVAGCGATFTVANCGGSGTYVLHTLQQWGDLYSSNAFVSSLSVGAGSGAGAGFDANIDNLALTTNAFGVTNVSHYDFAAAVPEPATWGLMLLGFFGIGSVMRRRQSASPISQLA